MATRKQKSGSVKNAGQKLFVVKKYVMAKSAQEALRKEIKIKPDDIWVDDEWRKGNQDRLTDAIGFEVNHDPDI